MQTFNVYLKGEDHLCFTIELQADSISEARDDAEEIYPEATVLEVFDPAERAESIYREAERRYDDPYYDQY